MKSIWVFLLAGASAGLGVVALGAQSEPPLLVGRAAFGDWRSDAPGVRRLIKPSDLPPPFATRSVDNGPNVVARPPGAELHVPPGFKVEEFAAGFYHPRLVRVAPNGISSSLKATEGVSSCFARMTVQASRIAPRFSPTA